MTWLAIALCLLVSFVFSGIEAGILSVNRVRLKHRLKLRDPVAVKLNRLLDEPERLLVTVLIVTNMMNIVALSLATQELVDWLGAPGYFVALVLFLPVYLVGLELLPKSLFRRFPYRALAALAEPLRVANLLLTPFHLVSRLLARITSRRPAERRKLFAAREEFKYLTIESERTGTLTKHEREMIHNVVDFRGVTAREVMIPIEQVRTVAAHASVDQLLQQSRATNTDRWPVVTDAGEIIGLVNVFDLALDGHRSGVVGSFQRRIVKVAPNEPAYSVLCKMRASRSTLAAVLATGVQPIGIVIWEDLIKRLVSTAAGDVSASP